MSQYPPKYPIPVAGQSHGHGSPAVSLIPQPESGLTGGELTFSASLFLIAAVCLSKVNWSRTR